MFFKERVKLRPSDYMQNNMVSYESIIQVLESVASNHAKHVGDYAADGNKDGIAWILSEWRIKIIHHPKKGEILDVTTWARGKTPAIMTYRDFIVCDDNENEVIRAEGKFVLINLNENKMIRFSTEDFAIFGPEELKPFDDASRIRPSSSYEIESEVMLRYGDMDFNGHLHNTRYITIALEGLAANGIYHGFSEVRISYIKAISSVNRVLLKIHKTEDGYAVAILSGDVICSIIELKF